MLSVIVRQSLLWVGVLLSCRNGQLCLVHPCGCCCGVPVVVVVALLSLSALATVDSRPLLVKQLKVKRTKVSRGNRVMYTFRQHHQSDLNIPWPNVSHNGDTFFFYTVKDSKQSFRFNMVRSGIYVLYQVVLSLYRLAWIYL